MDVDNRLLWLRYVISNMLGVDDAECVNALIENHIEDFTHFLDDKCMKNFDIKSVLLTIWRTYYDKLVEKEITVLEEVIEPPPPKPQKPDKPGKKKGKPAAKGKGKATPAAQPAATSAQPATDEESPGETGGVTDTDGGTSIGRTTTTTEGGLTTENEGESPDEGMQSGVSSVKTDDVAVGGSALLPQLIAALSY
ncbi:unnamed protein product [Ceratitis capitata]|uniref:(Mediterranean fruit fly) hypothetical protein n=1 Tax=Ceratitis capitata TaxID=7213 RepID=A0A811U6Z1_CERCA|nr:unnamed protein product [Ceratitis capitata]